MCTKASSWPTCFEKSKIPQSNPEKLQFKGSKIQGTLLDLRENAEKLSSKNAWILLPLNCKFSGLGWWALKFIKPCGSRGIGAYSEAMVVSQFMQVKLLLFKNFSITEIFVFLLSLVLRRPWVTIDVTSLCRNSALRRIFNESSFGLSTYFNKSFLWLSPLSLPHL